MCCAPQHSFPIRDNNCAIQRGAYLPKAGLECQGPTLNWFGVSRPYLKLVWSVKALPKAGLSQQLIHRFDMCTTVEGTELHRDKRHSLPKVCPKKSATVTLFCVTVLSLTTEHRTSRPLLQPIGPSCGPSTIPEPQRSDRGQTPQDGTVGGDTLHTIYVFTC